MGDASKAATPGSNRSTMVHVETAAFHLKDGIDEGAIDTEWVAGVDCAADALSKAVGRKLFYKFKPFLMGSAEREMALAMVAQALDRQNKVVALAATSVDEELRTIAAGVVAMANSR